MAKKRSKETLKDEPPNFQTEAGANVVWEEEIEAESSTTDKVVSSSIFI